MAANLVVTRWGAGVSILTASVLIGFNITSKDALQDRWGLGWKLWALIGSGSLISWALNRSAGRIALASFAAFAASSALDALVYWRYRKLDRMKRVNISNFVSAAADSVLFLSLAFGWPPNWWIVYGQFTAKVAGGLLWSLVLR